MENVGKKPDVARIPLTFDCSDETQRMVCNLLKSAGFCDSPKGADSSAIVYTLVETAKANGLDPYRYLERTLTELPYLGKNPKQEYLDAFMPWSSAMHRVCTLPAADHSAGVL